MNKLKMAHEVACAMINNGCSMHTAIADAWDYADAMQAEVDKRKPDVVVMPASVDDFKIDWSQAPDNRANHWSKESNGTSTWWIGKPTLNIKEGTHHDNDDCACLDDAPSFNYTGAWQDSLRKRPQEDKQ